MKLACFLINWFYKSERSTWIFVNKIKKNTNIFKFLSSILFEHGCFKAYNQLTDSIWWKLSINSLHTIYNINNGRGEDEQHWHHGDGAQMYHKVRSV